MNRSEISRQLAAVEKGDHLCSIYASSAEQMAVAVPFMVTGLKAGERCVYIADDESVSNVRAALARDGVDVIGEERRGALAIIAKRDAYLRSGSFDPAGMMDFLAEGASAAIAGGFSGLRGTGEMTWALGDEIGCERVMEYEARLNDFLPGRPITGLCQFSRTRFAPSILIQVLKTHPVAVLGDLVCPNLFFQPARMALGDGTLEERLEWMIEQLKQARIAEETLERAIGIREEFLCLAAHELRTPLTPLHLAVQSLNRLASSGGLASVPNDVVTSMLGSIERQCKRLESLVERLLDVSRIEVGLFGLKREEVDLGVLVRQVVDNCRDQLAENGCETTVRAEDKVAGMWDRARLEQVIVNLVANASRYGAGHPIEIAVERRGKVARLSVTDHGIGIDPELQERVFERFVRATGTEHFGGLGLGLYIVREIVRAHGGTVRVESTPLKGATFTIELPI